MRGCGWWELMIFFISASPVKATSAISLTLRQFSAAREKPIIYLLALQKVGKESPVTKRKAYYGSKAITESLKEQADRRGWLCRHLGRRGWAGEFNNKRKQADR